MSYQAGLIVETIFLAMMHNSRGNDAGRTTFSDLEAIIHLPVAVTNTRELFQVEYQVRSIVARADGVDVAAFQTLHRRRRGNAHIDNALEGFASPHPHAASVLLVALRRCECQESDS